MASSQKLPSGLNKWLLTDIFDMDDFNADNAIAESKFNLLDAVNTKASRGWVNLWTGTWTEGAITLPAEESTYDLFTIRISTFGVGYGVLKPNYSRLILDTLIFEMNSAVATTTIDFHQMRITRNLTTHVWTYDFAARMRMQTSGLITMQTPMAVAAIYGIR